MFEKMLFSGKALYFRYAPPLTDLDEISDDDLPNRPYPQAEKFERSVYFYWWSFLRENEAYIACCEAGGEGPMNKLYADFGDVRGESFMDWWKSGKRLLFCEPDEAEIVSYAKIGQHSFGNCPKADIDHLRLEPEKGGKKAEIEPRKRREEQNLEQRIKGHQACDILAASAGQLVPHKDHCNTPGQANEDDACHIVWMVA